jgi:RimJ/RimL family protein N-acetyltransferase
MDGDPLAAVDWPVLTERLLLRRATEADAEPTWRIRSLPAVYQWITSAPATLAEHAERFVPPSSLAVTVIIERDGRVIGDLMVRPDDPWAQREVREQARGVQVEIGWTLHPDEGGNGYATEAVRAMLDLCFHSMGLRRVVAGCFADNTASWRLMERVGMRREEHSIRSELHRSGRWLDAYAYAILRDEWTPSGA